MPQDRVRTAAAFTLIEVLVVIAIIAILAALLFPVFAKAKLAAQAATARTHGRELGLAAALYLGDWDGTFPLAAYATSSDYLTWPDLIQPYLKNTEIWWIPTSKVHRFDGNEKPPSH